jgi:threonine/homoserine/homoserine lactone efflux protein
MRLKELGMLEVLVSGGMIGVAIALPVGPVITEIIRRGLQGGFLSAWLVGLGAAVAHAILVTLTLLGVVALLDRPVWHTLLGMGGIIVLGYLGLDAIRAGTVLPIASTKTRGGHPFLVGFGIGIANPITLLWFLTVGGALIVTHGAGSGALALAFSAGFVTGVLSWDTVVAWLAGRGRRWLGPRTLRALNLVAGLIFFGFAVRLLWTLSQTLR